MQGSADAEAFRAEVLGWYEEHGRHDLPWRLTRDPYAILVSEVMLQQTQVPRVLPKYESFLAAFPTFESLAGAPLEAVLREWSGLGYNSRGMRLKRAAEAVVERFGGELPADHSALVSLPGIGPATAAAVMAFAFGIAVPYVETNIRAVYLHVFFSDACDVPDRELLPVVEATLDREDPRTWYYALMDYGVKLKRELPNPCRRSRHHARQSPFEGSLRQLRAAVLRALVESGPLSVEALAEEGGEGAGASGGARGDRAGEAGMPSRLEEALSAMEREGLVARDGERWRIA